MLLSGPLVIEIVDTFFDNYNRETPFSAESLIENLGSETARQQLREALLRPPFHSDQEAEIAVTDFKEQIHKKKISETIKGLRKQGKIKPETLNQLLKLKARISMGS